MSDTDTTANPFGFDRGTPSARELLGGVQWTFKFPNGYGASVIRHRGSYGHGAGLWELAVLRDGRLNYETPITNDVLGHLTEADVASTLTVIEALAAS